MSDECSREDKVRGADRDQGAKLIFQWVKTGLVNLVEFRRLLSCLKP